MANSIPNDFYTSLGVKPGDELLGFNGQAFNASDPTKVLMAGFGLEEGSEGVMKVRRDGKEVELKGKIKLNYEDGLGYKVTDASKTALKNAWLKQ
jgi:S1-C subfamily serine protease